MKTTLLSLIFLYCTIALFAQDNGIDSNTDDLLNDNFSSNDEHYISEPFPNPVKTSAKIYYKLPQGVNKGFIVVYNILGNEVVRINVDEANHPILIKVSDFNSGTYFYLLEYENRKSPTKRLIIQK